MLHANLISQLSRVVEIHADLLRDTMHSDQVAALESLNAVVETVRRAQFVIEQQAAQIERLRLGILEVA